MANTSNEINSSYTEQVRSHINKRIGGVYAIGTEFRNASLLNNPTSLRYKEHENAESSSSGDDIGQKYIMPSKRDNIKYLDEIGGLSGFTFENQLPNSDYDFVKNRLNRALFLARQTNFERNLTTVRERYYINGAGVKFYDEYNTSPGNNHSFGGVDTRGLANRISQLYADVFGIVDYKGNPVNRHYQKFIYNPALPLNPVNAGSEDFRRYNPINKLGYDPIYFGLNDEYFKDNEIFFTDDIVTEQGFAANNGIFTKLDRLSTLYGLEVNHDAAPVRVIRDSNDLDELWNRTIGKINREDESYPTGSRENEPIEMYHTPSKSEIEVKNKKNLNPGGISVDRPSYGSEFGSLMSTDYSELGNGRAYTLYNEAENGKVVLKIGDNENHEVNTTVFNFDDSVKSNADNLGRDILGKTNELFKQGKIGSLINRFHTGKEDIGITQSSVDLQYNLSRGRNLRKLNVTHHDGYENPYCRVWTSHYQYSKMKDLIRHSGYEIQNNMFPENNELLRPNHASNRLSNMSVLQDNGLPLIAPHSSGPDVPKELIKKCMFSIENLAWKDINKDAFVDDTRANILSKEQQGPNGGRIMWFPPYNLKFQENVGVSWNQNNFIGRGEPIYTYTNTERTGTLNFTILVDHPSIVDSWSYGKELTEENEQKLLRFFAGCENPANEFVEQVTKTTETRTKITTKNVTPEVGPTVNPKPKPEKDTPDVVLRYFVFFPNNFSGKDYYSKGDIMTPVKYLWEGRYSGGTGYEVDENLGISGCVKAKSIKGGTMVGGGQAYWEYEIDNDKKLEVLRPKNYKDRKSFQLNTKEFDTILHNSDDTSNKRETIMKMLKLTEEDVKNVFSYQTLLETDFSNLSNFFTDVSGAVDLDNGSVEISADVKGYASSHGYIYKNTGDDGLAKRRARFLKEYVKSLNIMDPEDIHIVDDGEIQLPVGNDDVSSLEAKLGRCAEIIFKLKVNKDKPNLNSIYNKIAEEVYLDNVHELPEARIVTEKREESYTVEVVDGGRYDDEYLYFKKINDENDMVRKSLVDKVHYFDPAFHSITPEGFNARLTFLHQCTRQGPTTAASDMSSNTPMAAGNLAFGRPPVCVLRIGDFYNTKIIIDSLSIDYDSNGGIQWDLNPEGVGVQPMLANVTLGFKFIGGSDLSGPIARLQNAVSYNFFANTSAYDRHSDYRNGYISKDDDTSMAWDAMLVNKDTNSTNHRAFTTTKTPKTTDNNIEQSIK